MFEFMLMYTYTTCQILVTMLCYSLYCNKGKAADNSFLMKFSLTYMVVWIYIRVVVDNCLEILVFGQVNIFHLKT